MWIQERLWNLSDLTELVDGLARFFNCPFNPYGQVSEPLGKEIRRQMWRAGLASWCNCFEVVKGQAVKGSGNQDDKIETRKPLIS